MQPKPHPMDLFTYHPAFCHLARGAAIPAIIEASMRKDSREDRGVSRSQASEDDKSTARPGWRTIGQRLAALRSRCTCRWHGSTSGQPMPPSPQRL
jgi:hypothetical protein